MHFALLVIGDEAYDNLYKYDENYIPEDELYTKRQIIRDQKRNVERISEILNEYNADKTAYIDKMGGNSTSNHILFLENGGAESFVNMTDDELYEEYLKDYSHLTPNENGDIPVEWNVDGRYDWMVLGGRWQGKLKLKKEERENGIVGEMSAFGGELKNDRCDAAPFGSIDWDSPAMKDFSLYGWVDNDGWFDRYTEDMDGDNNIDEWRKAVSARFSKIQNDEMVYIVDFHV